MPRTRVYEAVTERLEILDTEGQVDGDLMPRSTPSEIRDLYRDMVLLRTFDGKALKLQRQGRMGTWPPIKGQEAVQAGVALAMAENDWLIPAFREHGIMVLRGVPLHLVYAYWAGDERGSCFPEGVRCFPVAVPVGSQWQHGAGVGLSLKLRGEDAVAVTLGGDGSTSEGDFHEAVNCAGVFDAKTVFVIQNNQWAISVPLHKQTAAETLAQKAHAYGVPGIQVDGNDVFAVYVAAHEAIERARSGGGPTLIEAVDLSPRRSHDGRRRQPLSRRGRGRKVGGPRPDPEAPPLSRAAGSVGRRPGGGAARRGAAVGRGPGRVAGGDAAAGAGGDLHLHVRTRCRPTSANRWQTLAEEVQS